MKKVYRQVKLLVLFLNQKKKRLGDKKRATLLKQLTQNWATHFTATLITTILASTPYLTQGTDKRERFLKEFTRDWGFSKLSEFFMFLRSKANVDCRFKCAMLQEAAKRDAAAANHIESTPKDYPSRSQPHHRRTSSNDFKEIKLSMLEEINTKQDSSSNNHDNAHEEQRINELGSSTEDSRLQLFGNRCYTTTSTAVTTTSSSAATNGTTVSNPSPLYPHRQTGPIEASPLSSSTSSSANDRMIATSETNANDKKRLTSGSKQM